MRSPAGDHTGASALCARVLEHDPPVCTVRVHHENRVPIDAGKRGVGHQEPAVGRVRRKDAGADNGEFGIATERRRHRRPRAFERPVEHHAPAVRRPVHVGIGARQFLASIGEADAMGHVVDAFAHSPLLVDVAARVGHTVSRPTSAGTSGPDPT